MACRIPEASVSRRKDVMERIAAAMIPDVDTGMMTVVFPDGTAHRGRVEGHEPNYIEQFLARETEEQSVEPPCPEDTTLIVDSEAPTEQPDDTTSPAECQVENVVKEDEMTPYTYRIPDNDSYKSRLLGMFAQNLVVTVDIAYPDGTTKKEEMSLNMYRAYLKALSHDAHLPSYLPDDHLGIFLHWHVTGLVKCSCMLQRWQLD